jgi:hypothetical protein
MPHVAGEMGAVSIEGLNPSYFAQFRGNFTVS